MKERQSRPAALLAVAYGLCTETRAPRKPPNQNFPTLLGSSAPVASSLLTRPAHGPSRAARTALLAHSGTHAPPPLPAGVAGGHAVCSHHGWPRRPRRGPPLKRPPCRSSTAASPPGSLRASRSPSPPAARAPSAPASAAPRGRCSARTAGRAAGSTPAAACAASARRARRRSTCAAAAGSMRVSGAAAGPLLAYGAAACALLVSSAGCCAVGAAGAGRMGGSQAWLHAERAALSRQHGRGLIGGLRVCGS